jgi:hypothetical protein
VKYHNLINPTGCQPILATLCDSDSRSSKRRDGAEKRTTKTSKTSRRQALSPPLQERPPADIFARVVRESTQLHGIKSARVVLPRGSRRDAARRGTRTEEAKALAFHHPRMFILEVLEVFVVRSYWQCLNRGKSRMFPFRLLGYYSVDAACLRGVAASAHL